MTDICFFSHFDRDSIVDPYVLHYLAGLKQLSFSIVFISASRLGGDDQAALAPYCDDVILRPNLGLDFGSWAAGLRKHANAVDGRLLLVNDSVYGAIDDLRPALARLTAEHCDFYGMVESTAPVAHLQSWFLLFENQVVTSAPFKSIFARAFETMDKSEIIRSGEVGLSRSLRMSGFKYRALYQPTQAGPVARNLPFNPMNYLWRELIVEAGVPFLKVGAMRNYLSEADMRPVVAPRNAALADMIAAHQRRINAPVRPMGIGHLVFQGFIETDHRLYRRGSRLLAAVNFLLCALLFKLTNRWLRQSAA
jgi:lipopolysaccharide biosynthesis protein